MTDKDRKKIEEEKILSRVEKFKEQTGLNDDEVMEVFIKAIYKDIDLSKTDYMDVLAAVDPNFLQKKLNFKKKLNEENKKWKN